MQDKITNQQAELSHLLPEIQLPAQSYQQFVLDSEPLKTVDFTLNMPEIPHNIDNGKKLDAPTSIYGKVQTLLTVDVWRSWICCYKYLEWNW
jgi:hypothetical protein